MQAQPMSALTNSVLHCCSDAMPIYDLSIISHGPLANQTRHFHSELVSELNTSPTLRTKPIRKNDPGVDTGHFGCRCRVVLTA